MQLVFRLLVVLTPLITSNQVFQIIFVEFVSIFYLLFVFGKRNLYKVDKIEVKMRLFIEYLIMISFQTLHMFVGRLVMEDPDCDTSQGVCSR